MFVMQSFNLSSPLVCSYVNFLSFCSFFLSFFKKTSVFANKILMFSERNRMAPKKDFTSFSIFGMFILVIAYSLSRSSRLPC